MQRFCQTGTDWRTSRSPAIVEMGSFRTHSAPSPVATMISEVGEQEVAVISVPWSTPPVFVMEMGECPNCPLTVDMPREEKWLN